MTAAAQAPSASFFRAYQTDVFVCAALTVMTAALAVYLQQHLAFTNTYLDVWFDTDSNYVIDQMTNRFSPQNNTASRHPLIAILIFPLSFVFFKLGFDPAQAAMPMTAIISALFVVTTYWVLRLMNRPVGVSLALTGVLAASAPGILMLGIHERIILAGVTVTVFLAALALFERRKIGIIWLTVAAALTLGATITNFFVAVVALPLVLGWKKGLQVLANAVVAVTLLGLVGQAIFPHSTSFPSVSEMKDPMNHTTFGGDKRMAMGGTVAERATVVLLHSAALPQPELVTKPEGYQMVSVQRVGIGGQQPIWYIAIALWLGLLVAGAVGAVNDMRATKLLSRQGIAAALRGDFRNTLPWVIPAALVGQIVLFMAYGQEIVLFAPYYVPLMILLIAMAWRPGSPNRIMLAASVALFGLLAVNNGLMFANALELSQTAVATYIQPAS